MRMNYRAIIGTVGIFLSLLSACRPGDEKRDRTAADNLYSRIISITRRYTDSIGSAKDSTTLFGLIDRYEERIVKINYDALPDTDFNLTEGQNDTISLWMDSLLSVKVRRLYELGHPEPLPADTVGSADSLPVE